MMPAFDEIDALPRRRLTPTQAQRRLYELGSHPESTSDRAISEIVDILASLTGALGAVFLSRSENQPDRLQIASHHIAPPHLSNLRSLLQHFVRLGAIACAEATPQAELVAGDDEVMVVVVPVLGGRHGHEAVGAAIVVEREASKPIAAYLIQVLTWVSAFLGPLRKRAPLITSDASHDDDLLRSANTVVREASRQASTAESCKLLAEWIRSKSFCETVMIGLRHHFTRGCRVTGISGRATLDPRSKVVQIVAEVCEETLIAHNDAAARDLLAQTAASRAIERDLGLSISARHTLLDANDSPYGVILCLRDGSSEEETHVRPLPVEVLQLFGHQLSMIRAAKPHPWLRAIGVGNQHAWYRIPGVWLTTAAVLVALLIPVPTKVACDCVVQPRIRRYVSIPYDGRLDRAMTEPGQVVKPGQLLASMDGKELEWEISGLQADLERASKDRDTALAAFDRVTEQLAALEVKRLELQIAVLRNRLNHLEIRSPVDGVVMGGDPRRMVGARMSTGDTLLEVGPLDQLILELEIADEDIWQVQVGQPVSVRLAAMPWVRFKGTLDLIHPRAEIRSDMNVFVAELSLKNDDRVVRPGMRGRAKILGPHRALGWNLFHKARDNVMTWLLW